MDIQYSIEDGEAVPFTKSSKKKEAKYYFLPTPILAIFQFFMILVYFSLLFVPFDEKGKGYNMIICGYIIYWIFIYIFYRIFVYFHVNLKSRGYILLNSSLEHVVYVPLAAWSFGMAFIALLFVFLPAGTDTIGLKPVNFLQILVGFLFVVILVSTIWYSVITIRYNIKKPLPDALNYLQTVESTKNLVKNQPDMIQYLNQQLETLGRDNVRLHSILETQNEIISTSQRDDLADVIQRKEQELRNLEAQVESLISKINRFESRELDEKKLAELQQQKVAMTNKVTMVNLDNQKYRLLHEVEKDANIIIAEEIKNMKKQLRRYARNSVL